MIDFGVAINNAKNYVGSVKPIRSILTSVIWTSAIIIGIIMVMVLIYMPTDIPGGKLIKFFVYSFIGVFAVVVLHNSATWSTAQQMNTDHAAQKILNNISEENEIGEVEETREQQQYSTQQRRDKVPVPMVNTRQNYTGGVAYNPYTTLKYDDPISKQLASLW